MLPSLRTLAERLSRGVVLKRALPGAFGRRPLYVSPDAALRFWSLRSDGFDPALFRFVQRFVRPGDTVIDAGANVGLFTFAAAQLAGPEGHVVAVDADEWLVSLLRRSIRLGVLRDEAPIAVVHGAITDTAGLAKFSIASRGRAANYLTHSGGGSQTGGKREELLVVTTTIDLLAAHTRRPSVLKIDLEGAELLALRGADCVLTRDRPIILCEIGEENANDVAALLAAHDFVLYDADGLAEPLTPIERPAFNTIACPRERISAFSALRAP